MPAAKTPGREFSTTESLRGKTTCQEQASSSACRRFCSAISRQVGKNPCCLQNCCCQSGAGLGSQKAATSLHVRCRPGPAAPSPTRRGHLLSPGKTGRLEDPLLGREAKQSSSLGRYFALLSINGTRGEPNHGSFLHEVQLNSGPSEESLLSFIKNGVEGPRFVM